jgi:hypothetical protein
MGNQREATNAIPFVARSTRLAFQAPIQTRRAHPTITNVFLTSDRQSFALPRSSCHPKPQFAHSCRVLQANLLIITTTTFKNISQVIIINRLKVVQVLRAARDTAPWHTPQAVALPSLQAGQGPAIGSETVHDQIDQDYACYLRSEITASCEVVRVVKSCVFSSCPCFAKLWTTRVRVLLHLPVLSTRSAHRQVKDCFHVQDSRPFRHRNVSGLAIAVHVSGWYGLCLLHSAICLQLCDRRRLRSI